MGTKEHTGTSLVTSPMIHNSCEASSSTQHTMKTAVIVLSLAIALVGVLMSYLKQNSPLGEDLLYAVRGEVMGEQFFRIAHYASTSEEYKHKFKLLWELEKQTKLRLMKYLHDNSFDAPWFLHIYDFIEGNVNGFLWATVMPRTLAMRMLRDDTAGAMKYYENLVEAAIKTKDIDKKVFDAVLDHEIAINHFSVMEHEGNANVSIDKVAALIGDSRLL